MFDICVYSDSPHMAKAMVYQGCTYVDFDAKTGELIVSFDTTTEFFYGVTKVVVYSAVQQRYPNPAYQNPHEED